MGIPGNNPLVDPDYLSLSPCRELRELELEISGFFSLDRDLGSILSITSTNIEKIIINRSTSFDNPLVNDTWARLDNTLTELVERLELEIRLEVELRGSWHVGREGFSQKNPGLPRFVKKGRMTVWDYQKNLVYCSGEPEERK